MNALDNLAAPQALADIRPRAVAGHSLKLLAKRREAAERAYRDQAAELERRLARTERNGSALTPTSRPWARSRSIPVPSCKRSTRNACVYRWNCIR